MPENPADLALLRSMLQPLLPNGGAADLLAACRDCDENRLAALLHAQGLASFWHAWLRDAGRSEEVSAAFLEKLHRSRLQATGLYLVQQQAMRRLRTLLDAQGVQHLVFKGGHIRERLYEEPALRPATDLDVLVPLPQRRKALEVFRAAGYGVASGPQNISHEICLDDSRVVVDLHWDLLRPGRTRQPLAQDFLDGRQDYGSHWGPRAAATLFLMLVHPVFTKYVTTPQAMLVRVLDLFWWLHLYPPEWDELDDWLDRAGLYTAAWVSLEWARRFGDLPVPADFQRRIAPGPRRRRYLHYWIDHNLPGRLLGRQWMVQLGFTLPVHDRVADVWRVLRRTHRARREAAREWTDLMSECRG